MSDMDNLTPLENEIQFAAEWWTARLRETFDTGSGELFSPKITALPDEQVEAFRLALIKEIRHVVEVEAGRLNRDSFCAIRVDYDADETLEEAAKVAGFNLRYRLPTKTTLKIYRGRVEAKRGYGAGFETVWKRGMA